MQYREIVAVTGLGGLFHLMATKADGAIVRSLADNSTKFIPARLHNVTPLESIEVYTTGANVRLHEVLQKMKDSDVARPDVKKTADKDIRGYFKTIFPELDEERVYTSDLKKMLKWFDLLKGADLLDFSAMTQPEAGEAEGAAAGSEEASSTPVEAEAQVAENNKEPQTDLTGAPEGGDAKPAKKAAKKKAAAEPAAEGTEEAPTKKAAPRKKKAETDAEGEAAPKKTAKKKKEEGE